MGVRSVLTSLRHRTARTVSSGKPYPLGATLGEDGVNFALYSRHADEVYLLLFDAPQGSPTDVIRLDAQDKFVWHALVHGVSSGQLYGYRVRGRFDPAQGFRFNEHKLLVDPYAKALTGKHRNAENLLLGYVAGSGERDLSFDARDNADCVPKAIVVDDRFDWQGDAPLDTSLGDACIYEVHLKGFTAHPSSGVAHPGTYLGFVEKIPVSEGARRQRRRASPGAGDLRRGLPSRARADQLLGLQHDRLLRAGVELLDASLPRDVR